MKPSVSIEITAMDSPLRTKSCGPVWPLIRNFILVPSLTVIAIIGHDLMTFSALLRPTFAPVGLTRDWPWFFAHGSHVTIMSPHTDRRIAFSRTATQSGGDIISA